MMTGQVATISSGSLAARRRRTDRIRSGLLLLPATAFLVIAFVVPLVQLLALSFSSPQGAFAAWDGVIARSTYQQIFLNTIKLSATVTAICIVLAYPVAFTLTRLQGTWFSIGLYCTLVPFWLSLLVRTYSWILILERNGLLNSVLLGIGVLSQPLPLLFNAISVHIGMVHVLMPYAILPIYACMKGIDPALLRASSGLGASRWTTFWRVYLPLSIPGVGAGAVLVFVLGLGFFVTPALLGGARDLVVSTLIDQLLSQRLAFDEAAAVALTLLGLTLLILAIIGRLVPIGSVWRRR